MKKLAVSATLWSGADVLLRHVLQFAVAIALARLITPEEFGTVALLYLFTGIAGVIADSGFAAALIQRQNVTEVDTSTVFWVTVVAGLVMALVLWASAPLIASFFELPILVPLTAAFAVNLFLSALGSTHSTLLTKRLDFRTQAKIGVTSTLIAAAVAVAMAWWGSGVWALAAQAIVTTAVSTLLLWIYNPWRPTFVFSRSSARALFGFGGYLLASGLLDVAYNRMYTLLIGKFHGVRDLGFYSRADSTVTLASGVLTGILGRVAFPVFSAAASDPAQLRRGVRMALRGMMLINLPLMLGMAAVAEPLVVTVYGEQWLPCVPALQVLCLAGLLWPLHVINLNVLMAQGHSHLFFRLEVVKKVLGTAFLVVGTLFGVMGIAWSRVAFGIVAFLINSHYTERHLGYGPLAQTRDFIGVLGVSAVMAAGVYWLDAVLQAPVAVRLAVLTAVGIAIFFVLARVCKLTQLSDVLQLLPKRSSNATSK